MSNDENVGSCEPSSLAFHHSLGIRISIFVVVLLLAASGCGPLIPGKPDFYRIEGRVIDAATREPLPYVHLYLKANIPTSFGVRTLSASGFTQADGRYTIELGEGFDVLETAARIRLDASRSGYLPGGTDLQPPKREQKVYTVPDIFIAPGRLPPSSTLPPGVPPIPGGPKPGPWQ